MGGGAGWAVAANPPIAVAKPPAWLDDAGAPRAPPVPVPGK